MFSHRKRLTRTPLATQRRRGIAAVLLGVPLLLVGTATASAHVRVHPDSTTTGSYSQLTFRVPNESATAGTVKVSVTLPQDHPFTSVSTTPVAGWTAKITTAPLPTPVEVGGATITEAPRTVTWTAQRGVQIRSGEYQDFPISVGPLPAPGQLVLPATQTYSDGTVVDWSQTSTAGQAEPDHPAPEFTVTPATDVQPATSTGVARSSSDPAARWMAAAALLLSVLAAGAAAIRSSKGAPTGSRDAAQHEHARTGGR